MEVFSHPDAVAEPDIRLKAVIEAEFPDRHDGVTYLNTGSAGRKSATVLDALNQGLKQLNSNPTLATFIDHEPIERARKLAASHFAVDPSSLLLTGNSTQGLQLIMQSFLLKAGDELVTTNHEHGSTKTIMRYLEETRGIVVRTCEMPEHCSSSQFCFDVLSLCNDRTKLVVVSEIDSFTGWRPELSTLIDGLELLDVPLLVDGAHTPGHVLTRPGRYPMWVGSGHKWLCGPNGTGFTYVKHELIPHLEPVCLGDQFYERRDLEIYDLTRFECRGTSDICQWYGLSAAFGLYDSLNLEHVRQYQRALIANLRARLASRFDPVFRTPAQSDVPPEESTAILAFYFPEERVKVKDLRGALWDEHKIWIQPDNISDAPGLGARISCHYSVTEKDIDRFLNALAGYIE